MPKYIAFSWAVAVDDVTLDNFARDVQIASEHASVPVTGFNPTGVEETLAGTTTQSITVEFYGSYGAGEVHQTLYPLHKNRDIFPIAVRHDLNSAVSATNPEWRGNVQALTYSPGVTQGEPETFSVEFTAADADGIVAYDVAAA